MRERSYLPSAQFMVIVGSLFLAGATVTAAQYYVSSKNASATLAASSPQAGEQDWEGSLASIQAQSGINLPDAPDPNAVQSLLEQAQSDNLTDSIGRSLLVRITTAGVQGLGDDIPTQDQIISAASQQINASSKTPVPAPILQVETNSDTLRTFGNGAMTALTRHPKASFNETLGILAKSTDTRDPKPLADLVAIGREYKALADDLASVPTPKTLAPLYQRAVSNMVTISLLYEDLGAVVSDPVRGLAALQQYQQLVTETSGVFTNMAQTLKNGGILFSKDEPGSAWEIFLSAS